MKNPGVLFNGYAGDFGAAVALGKVPGWASFRKYGDNPSVPSTGSEEMWPVGTTRVVPTVAAVCSVVSSSAADVLTSGTGAWMLVVQGLGADYADATDTIALNGVTPVAGTVAFIRVNRAYIITAGSGANNAGDITISVGGNPQAYIEALEGQTQQTHYTVPAGKTLLVTSLIIGCGRMAGSSDLHVRTSIKPSYPNAAWRAQSDVWLYNGDSHHNQGSFTTIPEKTDSRQIITSTAATQAYSIIGGFLIENKYLHDD